MILALCYYLLKDQTCTRNAIGTRLLKDSSPRDPYIIYLPRLAFMVVTALHKNRCCPCEVVSGGRVEARGDGVGKAGEESRDARALVAAAFFSLAAMVDLLRAPGGRPGRRFGTLSALDGWSKSDLMRSWA